MIRRGILCNRSEDLKIHDLISAKIDEFQEDIKKAYISSNNQASLVQVKDELPQRGIMDSDMKYHICDFSESLLLRHRSFIFEYSRTLFPMNIDSHIQLNIKTLTHVDMLRYSAENFTI